MNYDVERFSNAIHIVCPVHNGAQFLTEFIASLQAQTVQNWLLWVRNDGSRDDSANVLRTLASGDERIRILDIAGVQLGVVGAFGWLLQRVPEVARYIMFADQDDVWLPFKIEYTLSAMTMTEGGYSGPVLVHTDTTVVDATLNEIDASFWHYADIHPQPAVLQRLAVHNVVTGATVMMNRAMRERVGEIPADAANYDWWIGCVASAFARVVAVSTSTMLYRQHSTNDVGARQPVSALSIQELPVRAVSAWSGRVKVRADIAKAARQAAALVREYGPELPENDRQFLNAYAQIPHRHWLQRKVDIVRLHLRRESGWLSNFGVLVRA